MAERQFDVAIASTAIKESGSVEITLGEFPDEFADAEFSKLELRLGDLISLTIHDIGVA